MGHRCFWDDEKRTYVRDGRAPIPEKETTSQIMSAIKGKNIYPEKKLKQALRRDGVKGFRSHLKTLPGVPDICYPVKKFAIFVNGCFWHRCPKCKLKLPKSHTVYWQKKFARNVNRDKKNLKMLAKMGWKSKTIWECEIKKDVAGVVSKIKRTLKIRA
ncbi:very short patch repair endonuclease [Candidatus Saganbacteria bacterium CG08_land_8_20_14_0_20_45_16]|uniref:Very short patch repair endonuclease n=1 Tax=Candidatus Saganbacteria bacterium CG08_land_8_20_14_0_20_45_16 TaxID=2014293 RepID=A0A2H0XY52_UNCSA|nr:MAG: very short patch repair endonuclease [Candidatus Saganbacteria bacterium CG08_land_8_20_14_0_20_45_16]